MLKVCVRYTASVVNSVRRWQDHKTIASPVFRQSDQVEDRFSHSCHSPEVAQQYGSMTPLSLQVLQHLSANGVWLIDLHRPHVVAVWQRILSRQTEDAHLEPNKKCSWLSVTEFWCKDGRLGCIPVCAECLNSCS